MQTYGYTQCKPPFLGATAATPRLQKQKRKNAVSEKQMTTLGRGMAVAQQKRYWVSVWDALPAVITSRTTPWSCLHELRCWNHGILSRKTSSENRGVDLNKRSNKALIINIGYLGACGKVVTLPRWRRPDPGLTIFQKQLVDRWGVVKCTRKHNITIGKKRQAWRCIS